MKEEINKENIQRLINSKGETRGVVFNTDKEYILKEEGREGIKKIESEMKKLGCPIKYNKIKTLNFYPIGLRVVSLLVIKNIFNYNDEKIKEIGFFATKTSLIIKIFLKFFLSVEKVFYKEAVRMWEKHYTVGELVPVKLDVEGKRAVIRIKNLNLHPVFCCYLGGYFCGVLQMLIKAEKINFEETKCFLKGDKYHEYLIKWR